ncbi:MAG: glycosyltransferase [Verrucomicrobia bacterium]|nr:MAG: glycosyltransferase [Verrucomicrobiota bacterium]
MNGNKLRVAMYSPGMVGFGHIRRNASIAQALRRSALDPVIMMIAEARQAGALPMPPGVDCVTLPALCKESNGGIKPRFLDVADDELIGLRSKVISKAIKAFQPDVFIVDHLPLGAAHELERALRHCQRHQQTRCVLGVRDILQDPDTVHRSWATETNLNAIGEFYDAIWIYGDRALFDPVLEYELPPEVAAKVHYAGYLDQRPRLDFVDGQLAEFLAGLPSGKLALCVVGGGNDGVSLAEAFALADLPRGTTGLVVTGPYMARAAKQRLRRLIEARDEFKLLEFVSETAPLIKRAERVISMGGYNTMCEVLSFEKHALIVPRVHPKPEQWLRAQRMQELGLIDVLHPEQLTPRALTQWLARDLGPTPPSRSRVDFGGLNRIPKFLAELLGTRVAAPAPEPVTVPVFEPRKECEAT